MSGLSRSPPPAMAGPVDEKPAICRRPHRHGPGSRRWRRSGPPPGGVCLDRGTGVRVDVHRRHRVQVAVERLSNGPGCTGSCRPRRRWRPRGSCRCGRCTPRSQITILPATSAGSSTGTTPLVGLLSASEKQSRTASGRSVRAGRPPSSRSAGSCPRRCRHPRRCTSLPLPSVISLVTLRSWVLAPTVVTHGPLWSRCSPSGRCCRPMRRRRRPRRLRTGTRSTPRRR